jgi:hypothetical protein
MDTFKRLNVSTGVLYNDDKRVTDCYQLEQTDGGYQRSDGVWSEYEDEYIDEDESVYSEPLGTYIYRDGSIEVETGSSSRRGYYPEDYDSIVYDEYREEYIHEDDASYCEYDDQSFYDNDSVECITRFSNIHDYDSENFSSNSNNNRI